MDGIGPELARIALLGTERQPGVPRPGGALGALAGRLPDAGPEAALLATAAAAVRRARAGRLPVRDPRPVLPACPPEEAPGCGPRSAARLAALLGADSRAGEGASDALLGEWLGVAAAAGRLAPPARLPELLEAVGARPALRSALLPVLGRRGRWLATQHPDWAWVAALDADDETVWETGTRAVRRAWLARCRERDPERARQRLSATWLTEAPEDRAAFLNSLAVGLSAADEPLLEAALDDRRKEVRAAAAALLAALPGSALVARMAARLEPLFAYTPAQRRFLRTTPAKLDVTLPAACDPAMVRDGLDPKAPSGTGERAWWLGQLLARVPPAHWARRWEVTPTELLATVRRSEWWPTFLPAWLAATRRQPDPSWAGLLLTEWLGARDPEPIDAADLDDLLPQPEQEALTLRLLRAHPDALDVHGAQAPGTLLLRHCPGPWGPELSRLVLAALRRRLPAGLGPYGLGWEAHQLLQTVAARLDPALAAEAATGWPTGAEGWSAVQSAVEKLTETLRIRHELRTDFVADSRDSAEESAR